MKPRTAQLDPEMGPTMDLARTVGITNGEIGYALGISNSLVSYCFYTPPRYTYRKQKARVRDFVKRAAAERIATAQEMLSKL